MSRVTVWSLPRGHILGEPYETSIVHSPLAGYTSPPEIGWFTWYPQAHQRLPAGAVENGLLGLFLALLGALAALRGVRHDPWLLPPCWVCCCTACGFRPADHGHRGAVRDLAATPTRPPAPRALDGEGEDDPDPMGA